MCERGKFGTIKKEAYLAALRGGLRRCAAAQSVGVDSDTVRNHAKKDPAFAAAIEQAEIDACDKVEDALYQAAIKGNVTAQLVWLYNRSAGRWVDKRNNLPTTAKAADMTEEQIREALKQRGIVVE